jgi:hypothetical protein
MTDLDIAGLGLWSENFANWKEFSEGLETGCWKSNSGLQPRLISPTERRRAPQMVKIAVEVMSQACEIASVDPSQVATVFSSAMGDMEITDYLCNILGKTPGAVSPTRFHNSVHNAPSGYWSMATGSHGPASAISAYSYTASMAFVEAAIQVSEENMPVLLVTQELAAPDALKEICPSEQPFSAAFLLVPTGYCSPVFASVRFAVSRETVEWPSLPNDLHQGLGGNFAANLLPLLIDIATTPHSARHQFPLSKSMCLTLSLSQ